MYSGQGSSGVKLGRTPLSAAHARRRARIYSNSVARELLNEESADEPRSSRLSNLVEGPAAFLSGLLKFEMQREVSESESKV